MSAAEKRDRAWAKEDAAYEKRGEPNPWKT
jgi:hypothetical protein